MDDFSLGSQQFFFDTNLIPAGAERNQVLTAIGFPNILTPDSPLIREGRVSRDSDSFFRRLDPSLVIPESYQTNLGFERELGRKFVFEANYTWNRGIHLWREFNANAPLLPAGFRSFTDYLLSRDFPNLRACPNCSRPLFNGAGAGELVRFTTASTDPANPSAIGRTVELGLPVTIISLNSITGTNTASQLTAALAAINSLRPNPSRTEIEQLASIGNSFFI